jgi:hypothetical protein
VFCAGFPALLFANEEEEEPTAEEDIRAFNRTRSSPTAEEEVLHDLQEDVLTMIQEAAQVVEPLLTMHALNWCAPLAFTKSI